MYNRQVISVYIYIFPTSQRPHFTGAGHTKPILKEVKDQVLLGLWTCRDYISLIVYSWPLTFR